MPKDFLGREIEVGDVVLRTGDKYFDKGVVKGITAVKGWQQFNIAVLSEGNTKPGTTYAHRLIVLGKGLDQL